MLFLLLPLWLFSLNVHAQQDIFDSKGLVICGHRGGFYENFPENSLKVIDYVIGQVKHSRLILEVDIRSSKEGTLFIMHDETVDRTTNGKGKIAELSDVEIRALRLKNSAGEMTDQVILSLEELLDHLIDKKVGLMLDIKGNLFEETASLILKKKWAKRSVFLTFRPEHTQQLYQISDQFTISTLIKKEEDWLRLEQLNVPLNTLIAYVERETESSLIIQARRKGFQIMADVSEHTTHQGILFERDYYRERLKKQELNILITDFPIEVDKMLANRN